MKERKGEGRRSFSPPQATKLCVLRHLRASWRNEDLANGIPAPRSVCGWSLSTWAPRGSLEIKSVICSRSGPRSDPRKQCAGQKSVKEHRLHCIQPQIVEASLQPMAEAIGITKSNGQQQGSVEHQGLLVCCHGSRLSSALSVPRSRGFGDAEQGPQLS